MAVSTDIFRAWRDPRGVMRRHLSGGPREDRALIFLMGASLLLYIGQMPLAARLAETQPSIPLDARLQTNFYVWLLVFPLLAYVLSLILFGIVRVFTAKANGYNARLALFWTLLAIAPASLLYGLCKGFFGETGGTTAAGVLVVAGFFWILIQSLRESLTGGDHV